MVKSTGVKKLPMFVHNEPGGCRCSIDDNLYLAHSRHQKMQSANPPPSLDTFYQIFGYGLGRVAHLALVTGLSDYYIPRLLVKPRLS